MHNLQNDENNQHGKINTTKNYQPSVKIKQKEATEEIPDNESASLISMENKNQNMKNNDEIENVKSQQKLPAKLI